jgi:hypothetical protein
MRKYNSPNSTMVAIFCILDDLGTLHIQVNWAVRKGVLLKNIAKLCLLLYIANPIHFEPQCHLTCTSSKAERESMTQLSSATMLISRFSPFSA